MNLKSIYHGSLALIGRRGVGYLYLSALVGVLLGGVEILLGLMFYRFLAFFELVPDKAGTTYFPQLSAVHPVWGLIGLAVALAGMRFLVAWLPMINFENLQRRVRQMIVVKSLGGHKEVAGLGLDTISHMVGNLLNHSSSFLRSLSQLVLAVVSALTLLVGLLYISWKLALVSVALGTLLATPSIILLNRISKYNYAYYRKRQSFLSRLIKDVRGAFFLRISSANHAEVDHLTRAADEISEAYSAYSMRHATFTAYPGLVAFGAILIIIAANNEFHFIHQTLLVPFLYLLYRAAGVLVPLFSGVSQLKHNYPFYAELTGWAQRLSTPLPSDGNVTPFPANTNIGHVDVSALSVGRDAALLDGIDFQLAAGDTLVISGSSGRGKTTLLMSLVGILPTLAGDVQWNRKSVNGLDPVTLRKRIGYAGPDPYLFEGSVADNLAFGLDGRTPTTDDMQAALDQSCSGFVADLPGALAHQLGEDGDGISAGQKQRLSLARALLREPDVLILDEATANVDEDTEAEIFKRIRAAYPEMIIIAVSHRNSMRRFATRQIEL